MNKTLKITAIAAFASLIFAGNTWANRIADVKIVNKSKTESIVVYAYDNLDSAVATGTSIAPGGNQILTVETPEDSGFYLGVVASKVGTPALLKGMSDNYTGCFTGGIGKSKEFEVTFTREGIQPFASTSKPQIPCQAPVPPPAAAK